MHFTLDIVHQKALDITNVSEQQHLIFFKFMHAIYHHTTLKTWFSKLDVSKNKSSQIPMHDRAASKTKVNSTQMD